MFAYIAWRAPTRSRPRAYGTPKLRGEILRRGTGLRLGPARAAGGAAQPPEALKWYGYAEAAGAPLSEEQLAWRLRAALRQGDWSEVQVSAEMMSPLQRNEPAWVYWQGRAAQALGNAAEARTLYARIAGGQISMPELAAEELGLPVQIFRPTAYTPTAERWPRSRASPASSARSSCISWASVRCDARMALGHTRHGRQATAGRSRIRAPERNIRPRHQHRRQDAGAARFQRALSRAVSRAAGRKRARAAAGRSLGARPGAPGEPFHFGESSPRPERPG